MLSHSRIHKDSAPISRIHNADRWSCVLHLAGSVAAPEASPRRPGTRYDAEWGQGSGSSSLFVGLVYRGV